MSSTMRDRKQKPQQTPLKLKYFSLLDSKEWQDGS
jgi:hypothetical protein